MSEVVLVVFLTLPLRHQNAKGLCRLDVSGACAANAPMNAPELQKIIDWLIDGARSAPSPPQIMVETGERLVRAGLPLWRVGVFVRTLHPDIFGRSFVWRRGAEVVMGSANFDVRDSDEYRSSPLSVLHSTEKEVRRRLSDSAAIDNSPFLADMREEGVTDYIVFPLRFTDGSIHSASWTTKRPGGFTEDHIEGLRKVVPPLARVIEIISWRRTASQPARHLCRQPGRRADSRRADTPWPHRYDACRDLAVGSARLHRPFRPAAGRNRGRYPQPLLRLPGPSIRTHGGDVLKFMGDGLLAVFPIDEYVGDIQQVCSSVLEAARESRARVEEMQYPIGDVVERFRFGVALHVGRILYGNIGGGNRLDFTCIGPAVNLAARLEKIAGRLSRTIVASAGFAGICAGGWTDLGEFPIAGFSKAERVYGLLDETPAA